MARSGHDRQGSRYLTWCNYKHSNLAIFVIRASIDMYPGSHPQRSQKSYRTVGEGNNHFIRESEWEGNPWSVNKRFKLRENLKFMGTPSNNSTREHKTR